jgi:hypothetical protein
MRAYRDHWQWKAGVAVRDWRYAVRICNIDVSDLAGSTPADLVWYMQDAEERINDDLGNRAFYVNRTVRRYLRKFAYTKVEGGGGLTWETVGGKKILVFGETPVRRVDALLNTEARVV